MPRYILNPRSQAPFRERLQPFVRRWQGTQFCLRPDTQYGDGKPHSLIALVHAVRGMQGMGNAQMFIDSVLLPKGNVRVAVLDGKKSDPSNGLKLEEGLCTHSLWVEMAYQLAGKKGFERIQ